MQKRFFIKAIVASVIAGGVIGCLNDPLQPVSINQEEENSTFALVGGYGAMDVGSGGNEVWVVSKHKVFSSVTKRDCYLYRWTGSAWQHYPHYGLRCAVSDDGKCYHVNQAGQIWWADKNNNNGQIPNPPNAGGQWPVSAMDIGVGKYSGQNAVWIIGRYFYQGVVEVTRVYRYMYGEWEDMNLSDIYCPYRVSVSPQSASDVYVSGWTSNGTRYLFRRCQNGWVNHSSYATASDIAVADDNYRIYYIGTGQSTCSVYRSFCLKNWGPTYLQYNQARLSNWGGGGISAAYGDGDNGVGCYVISVDNKVMKYNGNETPTPSCWHELP